MHTTKQDISGTPMTRDFNYRKAVNLLIYFANKMESNSEKVSKLKAIKLIWLADRYYLRHYARTITNDKYFAMDHGPVPSATLNLFRITPSSREYSQKINDYYLSRIQVKTPRVYSPIKSFNADVFAKLELETIELIWSKYGSLSAYKLRNHSHKFPEWSRYEKNFEANDGHGSFKMNITDFFKNQADFSGLFVDDEEYLQIAKDLTMA